MFLSIFCVERICLGDKAALKTTLNTISYMEKVEFEDGNWIGKDK